MKYVVYLTTNIKSQFEGKNKVYVGIHITKNSSIFDGYLGDGVYVNKASTFMYPKTPFQCAVKKYGVSSFKTSVIQEFNTLKEAFDLYKTIVNENFIKSSHNYNTYLYENLYNQFSKVLYQFDKGGNLIKKWNSVLEASEFYAEYFYKFIWAAEYGNFLLGSYWSYSEKLTTTTKCSYIYAYNLKGKLEKVIPSNMIDDMKPINLAAKNQSLIGNYYVSYSVSDEFKVSYRKSLKDSIIYVYNLKGELVSSGQAKKVMKKIILCSYKKLWNIFNIHKGFYRDYYFSFTPITEIPENPTNTPKKIEVFTYYGEFVESFNNIKELKDKYNLTSSDVNKIIKGKKNYKNYIFKYSK